MKICPRFFTLVLSLALCSELVQVRAEETPTPLVGFMYSSDAWRDAQDAIALYGFYSFKSDGSGDFSALSPIGPDNGWAKNGGTFANNKFYGYTAEGTWLNYTLSYTVMDAKDWSLVTSASHNFKYADSGSEESQKARRIPSAVLYDPIGETMYAFTHKFGNSDSGEFVSVDTATGEFTKISDSPYVSASACDATGQIFAIALDGNLYTVSHEGEFTLVGHTGYYPTRDSNLNGGAAFDFRTGKLFWTFYGFADPDDRNYNRNGLSALFTVDTTTGAAELSWSYPRMQYISSLCVQNAHPNAPDAISDLSFGSSEPLSERGVISFTVPSVTYAQAPISGNVSIEWFVDNVSLGTEEAAPGSKMTKTIEGLSTGMHSASVVATANGQTNVGASASYFFGIDTPQTPRNLTLAYDEGKGEATLTWDMPETGTQGGAIDQADIRYQIVRMPDIVTVARSAKGNSFTEKTDYPFGSYYYRVQPYYNSNPTSKGGIATSNREQMGYPMALPWGETFDKESSLNSFTIIDANGDGGSEWEDPCWKYDPQYYCAFYYGKRDKPADDWLITPALNLDPAIAYRITFKYYAYYGYGSHMRVATGAESTVEGMDNVILDKEFVSSFSDYPGVTESFLFAPREGDRFIGFHHLSQTMEHLSIDDILIEPFTFSGVPAQVTDVVTSATPDRKARLSFNLPVLTLGGGSLEGPLTVTIMRGDEICIDGIISDCQPGQHIEWTDPSSVQAVNVYNITVTNSIGSSMSTEVSVDLSRGIPVSVTNVVARSLNSNQVEITWNPSVSDTDDKGNPVDVASIRYLVYKPVPGDFGTDYILIGRDLDECRFIDDNPSLGYAADDSQKLIFYYVAPVNGDSEGVAAPSNTIMTGKSYNLPFAESWNEQVASNNPWTRVYAYGGTWYTRHQGYDPFTSGSIGIMTCESDYGQSQGMGGLQSPQIDLTSMANPELSFRMYRGPEYSESTILSVMLYDGTGAIMLPNANFSARADEAGWQELTVPLIQYSTLTDAAVIFLAYVSPDNSIHIDDVRIDGTIHNDDVKLAKFSAPAAGRENEPVMLTAFVENTGSASVSDLTVTFTSGNTTIGTALIESLAPGKETTATLEWVPAENMTGYQTLFCTIDYPDDNLDNNRLEARTDISVSNYPYMTAISGSVQPEGVLLSWNLPDDADACQSFIDSVEAYDAFAIDNVGSWTMLDLDQTKNFGFSNGQGGTIQWPNNDELQAFIVFDTEADCLPAAPFTPFSGRQAFTSWPAAGTANNDYLISPELPGDAQLISFYARSAMGASAEPFNVLVSFGGTDRSEFMCLNGDVPVKAGADWELYHFALPEGSTHFAINYVGNNGGGLAVDDIMYYGKPIGLVPDGYNVYRDGIKINSEPVAARTYLDTEVTSEGHYIYNVAPVFNSIESRLSDDLAIDVTGISSASTTAATAYGTKGAVVIRNAEGALVEIHAVDGRLMTSTRGSEYMSVPASNGVYIVRIADKAVKVIVK